jgi:hypothetical protein
LKRQTSGRKAVGKKERENLDETENASCRRST